MIGQKSMARVKIHIEKAGLQSMILDYGRTAYRSAGIPQSGVLDRMAASQANWLVGNPPNSPVVEITLFGPKIRIVGSCQIALTGGDLSATLNGQSLKKNKTLSLAGENELAFGAPANGCRAYLAIGGSWQIDYWMESCSVLAFGDKSILPGNKFEAGTEFEIESNDPIQERELEEEPIRSRIKSIRVLPGPEFRLFPRYAVNRFFENTFSVSKHSSRMGIRLEGDHPVALPEGEMISSGIIPGTIQIPRSGFPIILLADAQTAGGYPRVANVISADLDLLAQLKPGDEIQFAMVGLEEAGRQLRLNQEKLGAFD